MNKLDVDPRVHPAKRLEILLAIVRLGGATTWTELRQELGCTDGSLVRQLSNLADDGMVDRTARSPRLESAQMITRIWLTIVGREALRAYRDRMLQELQVDHMLSV